jgi:hypothetical protein
VGLRSPDVSRAFWWHWCGFWDTCSLTVTVCMSVRRDFGHMPPWHQALDCHVEHCVEAVGVIREPHERAGIGAWWGWSGALPMSLAGWHNE